MHVAIDWWVAANIICYSSSSFHSWALGVFFRFFWFFLRPPTYVFSSLGPAPTIFFLPRCFPFAPAFGPIHTAPRPPKLRGNVLGHPIWSPKLIFTFSGRGAGHPFSPPKATFFPDRKKKHRLVWWSKNAFRDKKIQRMQKSGLPPADFHSRGLKRPQKEF